MVILTIPKIAANVNDFQFRIHILLIINKPKSLILDKVTTRNLVVTCKAISLYNFTKIEFSENLAEIRQIYKRYNNLLNIITYKERFIVTNKNNS